MSRTSSKTTISPATYVLGRPVFAEDARTVIEQLNWSFQNRTQVHVSQTCAPAGWGGAPSSPLQAQTLSLEFRAPAAGAIEVLRYELKIQPEVTQVNIGAAVDGLVNGTPDDEVNVLFKAYDATTGALLSTLTLTFTGESENDTQKVDQFNTSTIGTSWVQFAIELDAQAVQVGSSPVLRRVRIQDRKETTLPAPVVEGSNGETLTVERS